MEKKIYTAPQTETVHLSYTTTLLDWSAPKADGGGGNTPEAKQAWLWDDYSEVESDDNTLYQRNLWDD